MKCAILYWLVFIIPVLGISQSSRLEELEENLKNSNSPKQKINALGELATYQYEHCYNIKCFDSLSNEAISISEDSYDEELELMALINYLNGIDLEYKSPELEERINTAKSLIKSQDDPILIVQTWLAISNAYLNAYDADGNNQHEEAEDASVQAHLNLPESSPESQIQVKISLGNSYTACKKYDIAFDNFMTARVLIEELYNDKDQYLDELEESLYNFYSTIGEMELAENMKISLRNRLDTEDTDYETKLRWHEFGLDYLKVVYGGEFDKEKDLEQPLSFARETENGRLEDYLISLYKTYLLSKKDYAALYAEFNGPYASFLENSRTQSPESEIAYFQMKGYFNQHLGRKDSTYYYFDLAEKLANKLGKVHRIANHYLRYGDLLRSNGELSAAFEKYKLGLESISEVGFNPFIKSLSKRMVEISEVMGNHQTALESFKVFHEASELDESAETKIAVTKILKNTEEKLSALKEKKLEEENKQKKEFQYLLIVSGVTLAILLMVFLSSLTVPQWVIKMLGFFNVLLIFEFIILLIDADLHHRTHGDPLPMFAVKVALLSILFPLHHYVEHKVVNYMLKHNLIRPPKMRSIRKFFHKLWPFLADESRAKE